MYKIASFCSKCHWHVDVVVDFRDNQYRNSPCSQANKDYVLHHFLYSGEDTSESMDMLGSHNRPRTYSFRCSAPRCPVQLNIHFKPPRFSEQDVETLTNQAQLRRRWEKAKEITNRADENMARRVDGPDFLSTYLNDSLNPVKGKTRIPALNRKFVKTFGRDCDSILTRLGFQHVEEEGEGGNFEQFWLLPRPEERQSPLESLALRDVIEDARCELNAIISSMPESERAGCKHQAMYPTPSQGEIERALSCEDCTLIKTLLKLVTNIVC